MLAQRLWCADQIVGQISHFTQAEDGWIHNSVILHAPHAAADVVPVEMQDALVRPLTPSSVRVYDWAVEDLGRQRSTIRVKSSADESLAWQWVSSPSACGRLRQEIRSGAAGALSDQERDVLLAELERATRAAYPALWIVDELWTLLTTVAGDQVIRQAATELLRDRSRRCRARAFGYLQQHFPAEARALIPHYANDDDPELLYSLAVSLRREDPWTSGHLLISAIVLEKTWFRDTLEISILESGEMQREHAVRLRDLARQGKSRYLTWLATELEQQIDRRGW